MNRTASCAAGAERGSDFNEQSADDGLISLLHLPSDIAIMASHKVTIEIPEHLKKPVSLNYNQRQAFRTECFLSRL